MFWEIGLSDDGKRILLDPQQLNSYSYARGNPVMGKDQSGRILDTLLDVGFIGYDLYKLGSAYFSGNDTKSEWAFLGLDVAGAATPFATGFGAAGRVAKAGGEVSHYTREAIVAKHGVEMGDKIFDTANTFTKSGLKFDIHLAERTVERNGLGINKERIIDTVKNGTKYYDSKNKNYSFYKDGIRVAMEQDGTLKTVVKENDITKSRFTKVSK